MHSNGRTTATAWHEIYDAADQPREPYRTLLKELASFDLPALQDRLDAVQRELGLAFEQSSPERTNSWFSDLLPHLFTQEEWDLVELAFSQRLRAFERLLWDVYGPRHILRDGVLPVPVILGSPQYQRSAVSLVSPQSPNLLLSGICLTRTPNGELAVKSHYFSHASGLSFMIQNRRLLARVIPDLLRDHSVRPLADVPTAILSRLRSLSQQPDPFVVLLSPGQTSAVHSEHGFLARRMGIPLVEGNDLLVLNDTLFLKTVSGLERVDVIYSRVADAWLDPLVFDPDSLLGVPGLVNCLRKGSAKIANGVGAQIVDDRSLLHFSGAIIRYYLGENPILPILPTYWLGDLDQREEVLGQLDQFQIRSLTGERYFLEKDHPDLRSRIRRAPHLYVAQSVRDSATTICFQDSRPVQRFQDHIVYALQTPEGYRVFPGALTRVSSRHLDRTESEHSGGGKDTWVLAESQSPHHLADTGVLHRRLVTSRVAEAFYWLGRYLERATNVGRMIRNIETIEFEELNALERKLYRPVWNLLLPSLEAPGKRGRRGMTNTIERYRLMFAPEQPGSVRTLIRRAIDNASSAREIISPEAWAVLNAIHYQISRKRYRLDVSDRDARSSTIAAADALTGLIPQFFAIAERTMLLDDGWRFCDLGMYVERAAGTGRAIGGVVDLAGSQKPGDRDVEYSAILRLIGSRDAYQRTYQTRSTPALILELLYTHDALPRSIVYCLEKCRTLLTASLPPDSIRSERAESFIADLVHDLKRTNWRALVEKSSSKELWKTTDKFFDRLLDLHHVIADNFINHQSIISHPQPELF